MNKEKGGSADFMRHLLHGEDSRRVDIESEVLKKREKYRSRSRERKEQKDKGKERKRDGVS